MKRPWRWGKKDANGILHSWGGQYSSEERAARTAEEVRAHYLMTRHVYWVWHVDRPGEAAEVSE